MITTIAYNYQVEYDNLNYKLFDDKKTLIGEGVLSETMIDGVLYNYIKTITLYNKSITAMKWLIMILKELSNLPVIIKKGDISDYVKNEPLIGYKQLTNDYGLLRKAGGLARHYEGIGTVYMESFERI